MHRSGRPSERGRGRQPQAILTLVAGIVLGCGTPAVPSPAAVAATTTSATASAIGQPTGSPSANTSSPLPAPPARLTWFQGDRIVPPPAGLGQAAAQSFATGIQALEPSIALLPDGTFGYQGWDFGSGEGTSHVAVGRPGSGSFRDISPTPAEISHDPYLAADPDSGRILNANLRIPGELDPTLFCIAVSFTDDLGVNWTASKPVCDADADRPRLIAAAPISSKPTDGRSIVYLCYFHSTATGQVCLKSLDGGRTFGAGGAIPPDGCDSGTSGASFGHLAADPHGVLYLARMSCGAPVVAISRDEGASWSQHVIGPPGWNGYNEMGVAVDDDGVMFGLWVSAERLPWLASSRDGGTTWSTPVMVAAPGVTEVNLPELDVGGSGRVAIGLLVSTDAPAGIKPSVAAECRLAPCREPIFYDAVTWHASLTVATDALAASPVFLSAILNSPDQPIVRGSCGPGRCKSNADFLDVLIDAAGAPWMSYVACPAGTCPITERGAWGSSDGMIGTITGVPLR